MHYSLFSKVMCTFIFHLSNPRETVPLHKQRNMQILIEFLIYSVCYDKLYELRHDRLYLNKQSKIYTHVKTDYWTDLTFRPCLLTLQKKYFKAIVSDQTWETTIVTTYVVRNHGWTSPSEPCFHWTQTLLFLGSAFVLGNKVLSFRQPVYQHGGGFYKTKLWTDTGVGYRIASLKRHSPINAAFRKGKWNKRRPLINAWSKRLKWGVN